MTSLYELSSSGRSGAFFFASHDNRFILKTIPLNEANTMLSKNFLPRYYEHVREFRDTLLTRYYGLHSLRYADRKIHFVVMERVDQSPADFDGPDETYDLKGSTVNRTVPLE